MKLWQIALATVMFIMYSCSKNSTSDDNDNYTAIHSVSQRIQASIGGTIDNKNGATLTIPPNALSKDTLITVSEIPFSKTEINMLAGVRFEPEGIELLKPALVTISFDPPSDWRENETVLDYDYYGNDETTAAWNGYYVKTYRENGKLYAKTFTTHFSGKFLYRNCHSGTLDYVVEQFQKNGSRPDSIMSMVRQAYPGEKIQGYDSEKVFELSIQRFLSTFFDESYSYNKGEQIPANVISELSAYIRSGRHVVLAFDGGTWDMKDAGGLYPRFPHTAALEERNGVIQIRNSANIRPNQKLIDLLGGINTVYYPFDKINEFRELQSGVPVELAAGVGPDGFSIYNKAHGISLYGPLNGKNWLYVSASLAWEDPWVFTSVLFSDDWKQLKGLPPRGRPWTAVKVFVQKPEKTLSLEGYTLCAISLDNLKCLFSNGNEWKVQSFKWGECRGSFAGYTFTATRDTTIFSRDNTSSTKDSTSIKITLDNSMTRVIDFSAVYLNVFRAFSKDTPYTYSIAGRNVPIQTTNPYTNNLIYHVSGIQVKDCLTMFRLNADNGFNEVKEFECTPDTYLLINIRKSQ